MNSSKTIAGSYEGSGTWHDATGKSLAYRVIQTNRDSGNGFEVTFTHDFDDGSIVKAHFTMSWVAPFLFRVDAAAVPIGNGYLFDDYCHYHMKVGEAFVEASYRSSAAGLEVFGSSSKNADGNYIAWRETLRRA